MKTKREEIFFLKLLKIGVTAALFSVFVLSAVTEANAQKKPRRKQTPAKKQIAAIQSTAIEDINGSLGTGCDSAASESVSFIEFDKNSNLTVTSRTKDGAKVLAANKPLSSLKQHLSSLDKKSVITVKFDPNLTYGSVAEILRQIRRATNGCANIEASTTAVVYYLPELKDSDMRVKPNPVTLVVDIKPDRRVFLNAEAQGSLSDSSELVNTLQNVFRGREQNGIFRRGSAEIEKTVFLKAASAVKFGDVVEVIDAIRQTGASPVGLQIDDLD